MAIAIQLSFPKIYCSIIGHQYYIDKNITNYIKVYRCSCCGNEVTNNAQGNLVPLTDERREIHESLQKLVAKRRYNCSVKRKTA